MKLRPYQEEVISKVEHAFEEFDRLLAVVPTGGGKTVIFSALAKRRQPERTLILAHREELIDQALAKLYSATGIYGSKEKAEFTASPSAPVVVASVQTMMRRLDRWPRDHFGLIVCDEAHHAISDSWQSVLRHFDAQVLGVTATPDRGDKRNLGQYFDHVAAEVNLFDLIRSGFLSRITVKSLPLEIDLSRVKQVAGDYDAGALGDALVPYLRSIAEAIRDHASFRRTLCFLPLIHTSQMFTNVCREVGLAAEHVDGYCADRKERLARFAAGEFDVLSNAMLLTEGFDDPGIDCIVILRPTRSRALYSQMVGRGTRVATDLGKENLLLLDFLWMHERHNLIRPAHLVAKSEEEAEVITKLAQEKQAKGASQEELELEGLAGEAAEQRHEALRKQLDAQKTKKGKLVDAIEYCLKMGASDLLDYEPTMRWESEDITEPQAKLLKRHGIDASTVTCKGQASQLISLVLKNHKITAATEAQKVLMKRMGHTHWETATQEDARQFFAGLRKKRHAAA